MIDLYTFLHRQEKRRGEKSSALIRLSLFIPLATLLVWGKDGSILTDSLVLGAFFIYALSLLLLQRHKYMPLLSTFSVILDSLMLSGALFDRSLENPAFLASSPLLFLYPLIIYFAFLRCDEIIVILGAVLNIVLYNTVFLLSLGLNPAFESGLFMEMLGGQLIRTLVLVIFALALYDQSRRIKSILKNQNDYFEKVRKRNKPLFDQLPGICEKYSLSKREQEVLKELIKGKTYRAIGEDLFVSLDTIKSHVKNIYRKTGISSRNELYSTLRLGISREDIFTSSRNGASV